MADLAGREAVAHDQMAVEHQPGADTLPDLEDEEAAVGGAAEAQLAEHRGVGVVGDVHRDGEVLVQRGGQAQLEPAEVGGLDHDAAGVDDARAADADAEQRPVGRVGQVGAEDADHLDRRVAGAAVAFGDPAVEDLAGQVDQRGVEPLVVAQVDRDGQAGVGDDAEHRGGLADPARPLALAQLFDETLGEQLGGQVAGGHPGQVGGAGQVGPTDGALAEHRPQDERPVVAAGVARDRLAPGLAAAHERPAGAAGVGRGVGPVRHDLFV